MLSGVRCICHSATQNKCSASRRRNVGTLSSASALLEFEVLGLLPGRALQMIRFIVRATSPKKINSCEAYTNLGLSMYIHTDIYMYIDVSYFCLDLFIFYLFNVCLLLYVYRHHIDMYIVVYIFHLRTMYQKALHIDGLLPPGLKWA